MGIIDCLAAGFRLVARRWWVVLIPIALDLFLWMGPRLGVTDVVLDFRDLVLTQQQYVEVGSQEAREALMTQTQQILDQIAANANLLVLLSAGIPGLPSLIAATMPKDSLLGPGPLFQVGNVGQITLWSAGLLVFGALLASAYVTWIGRYVLRDGEQDTPAPLLRHALWTWSRVLLFAVGLLIAGLAIAVPTVLLLAFALALSQGLAIIMINLAAILFLWAVVWALVYFYFVVDAIVLNRVGVLRAMWNSINVVTRNLWASVGIVILIWIISNGIILILERLEFSAWGTLAGIVLNAFVGSSLTAASLFFYRERYRRWQENPHAAGVNPFMRRWNGPQR